MTNVAKTQVHDFWNRASCGEEQLLPSEARELCAGFREVRIRTVLTHGDLLESGAGQRHRGPLLALARRVWPRWLFRTCTPTSGLYMLIECRR